MIEQALPSPGSLQVASCPAEHHVSMRARSFAEILPAVSGIWITSEALMAVPVIVGGLLTENPVALFGEGWRTHLGSTAGYLVLGVAVGFSLSTFRTRLAARVAPADESIAPDPNALQTVTFQVMGAYLFANGVIAFAPRFAISGAGFEFWGEGLLCAGFGLGLFFGASRIGSSRRRGSERRSDA